jgi:PhnB protein
MATVSTYLNFSGNTREAFEFYRSAFGTEFNGPVMLMGDIPPAPDMPPMSDAVKTMVMHVELPILGGHRLMGTDVVTEWGHQLVVGNNNSINLEPDTRAETGRLFAALAEGATDVTELQDMFWGAYFGSLCDKFGIRWMFNCNEAV